MWNWMKSQLWYIYALIPAAHWLVSACVQFTTGEPLHPEPWHRRHRANVPLLLPRWSLPRGSAVLSRWGRMRRGRFGQTGVGKVQSQHVLQELSSDAVWPRHLLWLGNLLRWVCLTWNRSWACISFSGEICWFGAVHFSSVDRIC